MTLSRSQIIAICPKDLFSASTYSLAKAPSSPIGEYFFRMISPFRSVNISKGSPSRMRSVRRISFGTTTLPNSSILRTIPVAFIHVPPALCKLLPLLPIFSANWQVFIRKVFLWEKHFFPNASLRIAPRLQPPLNTSTIKQIKKTFVCR